MEKRIHIETISELHEILGYDKPEHPLITLIDVSRMEGMQQTEGALVTTGYYMVALKKGDVCDMDYGRQRYDFQEGSLITEAPGQERIYHFRRQNNAMEGWMLCFHPDLIRGTVLGNHMDEYTFLSYKPEEALQLSQKEKDTITAVVKTIETEYSLNLDGYSHKLLLSNLETLLNYCGRFYGRQFVTRTTIHADSVTMFLHALNERFREFELEEKGIPTVAEFADLFGYSAYYLSDLLKKETGKGTQEYIHEKIIDKAKDLLLGTENRVSDIAYVLGYDHPEHFSRFFKTKVGMSPMKFRQTNDAAH